MILWLRQRWRMKLASMPMWLFIALSSHRWQDTDGSNWYVIGRVWRRSRGGRYD